LTAFLILRFGIDGAAWGRLFMAAFVAVGAWGLVRRKTGQWITPRLR
jgi:hypothetical protein